MSTRLHALRQLTSPVDAARFRAMHAAELASEERALRIAGQGRDLYAPTTSKLLELREQHGAESVQVAIFRQVNARNLAAERRADEAFAAEQQRVQRDLAAEVFAARQEREPPKTPLQKFRELEERNPSVSGIFYSANKRAIDAEREAERALLASVADE